jgi:hypothetical protein
LRRPGDEDAVSAVGGDGIILATKPRVMERPEPGEAVFAGPRDLATKERAVPLEPTVVIASGVVAFDEWGHALGARVTDRRAQADTLPAERAGASRRSSPRGGRQSTLLLSASAILLASAVLLARAVRLAPETHGLASAVAVPIAPPIAPPIASSIASPIAPGVTRPIAPAIETGAAVPAIAASALPSSPPPPPLPSTEQTRALAAEGAPASAQDLEILDAPPVHHSPTAERTPTAHKARTAPKPKRGDIVRDNPF